MRDFTGSQLSIVASAVAEQRITEYRSTARKQRSKSRKSGGYCQTCGASLPATYIVRHYRIGHKIEWQQDEQ